MKNFIGIAFKILKPDALFLRLSELGCTFLMNQNQIGMLRSIFFRTLILFCCFGRSVGVLQAQNFLVESLQVSDADGLPFRSWPIGGLQAPLLQWIDVTGDGRPDLFLQNQPDQLLFFRNDAIEGLVLEHLNAFPEVASGNWFQIWPEANNVYFLFAANGFNDIQVWEFSRVNNQFETIKKTEILLDTEGKPVFSEIGSIPQFTDIDCDSDRDYFTTNQSGTITFYEQVGRSDNGLPKFTRRSDVFAGISLLGTYCSGAALSKSGRHGAATISFHDLNGDEKPDILWTDTFIAGLLQLENIGTCKEPAFTFPKAEQQYPTFIIPGLDLQTSGFNVTAFGDEDFDGDEDMFVAVQGGFCMDLQGDAIQNLYFYRNTGSKTKPVYNLQTKRYLYVPDVGEKSTPAFFDVDRDGDLDLVVGNEDQVGSPNFGRLTLFEATGLQNAPEYRLKDAHFLKIEGAYNLAPAFGDLDGDGDEDLLLGMQNGRIRYYQNDEPNGFIEISRTYANIFVGTNSAPALADLDDDGDLDLLVGNAAGDLIRYNNIGTPKAPNFIKETENYLGLNVKGFSKPAFIHYSRRNKGAWPAYLMVGSERDGVWVYKNIATENAEAHWQPQEKDAFSKPFRGIRQEAFNLRHTTPTSITVSPQTFFPRRLIFGAENGGFIAATPLFVPVKPNVTNEVPTTVVPNITIFPNPITDRFTIDLQNAIISPVNVHVFDLLGREVFSQAWEATAASRQIAIEVPHLPQGSYIVRVTTRQNIWSSIAIKRNNLWGE